MSTMVDIDELLPEVMTHAPNAPEPVVLRYIREAAQELCRRGRLWREFDKIEIFGDADGEGVTTIPDAQIYRIEAAQLDDVELRPVTIAWLNRHYPGWRFNYDEEVAPAQYVAQANSNTVIVIPKSAGTLGAWLQLLPARDAISIPAFLAEQYAADIGKGAAGRVLTLPDAEYANPQLGAALVSEFQYRLDTIAVEAAKTQVNAPLRTRANFM